MESAFFYVARPGTVRKEREKRQEKEGERLT
jgi:hypothetical protein